MLTESPKLASFCPPSRAPARTCRRCARRASKKGTSTITGQKCFITNGQYADWYTVYAMTVPEAGHRGISAFVVPRDDTVVIDKKEDKMGQRVLNTATVTFNDTEIPPRSPPREG